ncbi:MAG: hypothetical protein JWR38_4733 [Mucilaginibacter sp.]|nr:hypothetical protein [Mucilaginibacter sp.]
MTDELNNFIAESQIYTGLRDTFEFNVHFNKHFLWGNKYLSLLYHLITDSLLPFFWNCIKKSPSQRQVILEFIKNNISRLNCLGLIVIPLSLSAQQTDTVKKNAPPSRTVTSVTGKVTDATSGLPLSFISIRFVGSSHGTNSDKQGKYYLSADGAFNQVSFSDMGYLPITRTIKTGQANNLSVQLKRSQTQLKEVKITSGKNKRYRNKGNPAVALIQEVIDHKPENRMESSDYLQYDQYERIGLSLFNLPRKLINSRFFSQFKFMLDTATKVDGQAQTSLPVFFSEKIFQNYYRKNPAKSIQILNAQKQTNIIKFVDTAGVDIYLNRLYGNNLDIYANNIFIITNQFLSPVADHAPAFYKFFITDTVQYGKEKLIEISFTPRNKGDLLFEGKLLVTMDGHYAVESCELNVSKQININFMRNLSIQLAFEHYPDGRYYLSKSDVKANFGILRNKGTGAFGERTVFYSNYKLNSPLRAEFYEGKSLQTAENADQADTTYWLHHRADTLNQQQALVYAHMNRLEGMRSFKRATWIASTFTGGFADVGPVQIGPLGTFFSFNNQEGPRFQLTGRTTPLFNKSVYLDGYVGYGTKDKQLKYDLNTYFSLNQTAPYRFPNDYLKVSYLYDVNLPGQSFSITNAQAALTSFHTGKTDYWVYNKIFTVAYVKDFENHFSYNLALKNWNQQPAGTLVYRLNDPDNSIVHDLATSEVDLGLRFAPHEKIIQGTQERHTIYSKYPIFNLQINHGFKGVLNGSYSYTNIGLNIFKRFYLSQLGYSDITILGNMLAGKVPFPLLNISPANQSLAYDPDAYNKMNYLEFVSDHYVGLNMTQSFNGFFLNKIPLIEHLKWREYLSFKILYGGLRNENNPLYSTNLYQFPMGSNGGTGTYALDKTPYVEAGAGIGNIFKVFRFDVIRRFNYLDHPGVSPYGIKFSFNLDF